MRSLLRGAAWTLAWVGLSGMLEVARGQQAPAPPPPGAAAPVAGQVPRSPAFDDAELAGLTRGAAVAKLTVEQVFKLAVIKARGPKDAKPAAWKGPEDLDRRAKEVGFDDFARLRRESLQAGFADPTASYLDLLARRIELEAAELAVRSRRAILQTGQELIVGEGSGFTQATLDGLDLALQEAEVGYLRRVGAYRDRLEAFRASLGLAVDAPVVLDLAGVSGFAEPFQRFQEWRLDRNRKLNQLSELALRLPAIEGLDTNADAAIRRVEGRAAKARGVAVEALPADVRLDLRRRARALASDREAYEFAKRDLVLAFRLSDSAYEQLIAPNQPSSNPGGQAVKDLLNASDRIDRIGSDLVTLWTRCLVNRLQLDRDLGVLDADTWPAFLGKFQARALKP